MAFPTLIGLARACLRPAAVALSLWLAASAAPAMAQSMNTIPNCDASRSSYLLKNMDVVAGLLKSDGAKFGALDIWGGCIRTTVTNTAGHTEILFYDPDTLRLVGTVN